MFLEGDMQGPDEDRRAEEHSRGSQDLEAPHVDALGVQGQHFPPGSSSDEDNDSDERDDFFDACVWKYVPEFTTEPAMSRAMAEYGFIPLVKRHRYVGRQEVERLQEEESVRKLIASFYPWLPQ